VHCGNKNHVTVFKEVFSDLTERLRHMTQELTDITIFFTKVTIGKTIFALLDAEAQLGRLVSSHFIELIKEANQNF